MIEVSYQISHSNKMAQLQVTGVVSVNILILYIHAGIDILWQFLLLFQLILSF